VTKVILEKQVLKEFKASEVLKVIVVNKVI
jgi:hypothetical protein